MNTGHQLNLKTGPLPGVGSVVKRAFNRNPRLQSVIYKGVRSHADRPFFQLIQTTLSTVGDFLRDNPNDNW